MSVYDLPTSTTIGDREYAINSDWRAAIDIITVMQDQDIDDTERAHVVLSVFYPEFGEMPTRDFQPAIDYLYWFVGGGGEEGDSAQAAKKLKLMDWIQDLPIIISPVNRVLGFEIRACEYLHWWTFLSAYSEIGGDCLFAQVVSIRKKRALGKKLDKTDQAFYQENRDLIDFKQKLTSAEEDLFKEWIK